MHAVSLTRCSNRSLIVHTVTPHGKYDTACTIDKRFTALAAFKGNIYHIYVPELSHRIPKKIYKFKGAT
jgi:hypothetical protein